MRPHDSQFLLFSGHNDRAVVALCRFFAARGLPFTVVAAGPFDAIRHTDHAPRVRACRLDDRVDLGLFEALAPAPGEPAPIYTPTTEFINAFVLERRDAVEALGWRVGLPPPAVYRELTDKWRSQQLMDGVQGLRAPPLLQPGEWRAPCVLKPRANLKDGRVLYPLLCETQEALGSALAQVRPGDYFAQQFLRGQSYYLCAYLARSGERAWFWQENLLQQAGGKSIVLARCCAAPGLDAERLLDHVAALGYHGPFMMEVIVDHDRPYFIEINPRFWGPLQLALDACPALLDLYASDHGHPCPPTPAPAGAVGRLYAWSRGAQAPGLKAWPALDSGLPLQAVIEKNDVYARPDTAALHQCH